MQADLPGLGKTRNLYFETFIQQFDTFFHRSLIFRRFFQISTITLRENLITPLPLSPAKIFAMKQLFLSFSFIFSFLALSAQDVTYVLFNRDCMNQLEYRYSYPNLKGDNAVWAYSMKPNLQEHYIFMTEGAGHYSPELPSGTITCKDLALDDSFVARINRDEQQMLVVFQRQSGGYWLMPVKTATLVARKGSKYWVRSPQSSFQFDTIRLVNEQNLAAAGSPTAAYFSGAKLNNCLMEYSFHCEPVKSGQIRSDFQFIPSIGILNDRTGSSASKAMENELQLVNVNGKAIDDFITAACPDGPGKIAISKSEKVANYWDERFEADKELSSIMQKEQDDKSPAEYSTLPGNISCADEWEPGTHIVQKGENLRAIARTYKVSEQQLVKWNKIQNPDKIEICQKIWLKQPPANYMSSRNNNKTGKVSVAETPAVAGAKTVKKQGLAQEEKGVQPQGLVKKSADPNRPIVYSEGATGTGEYQYSDVAKTTKETRPRIHVVHRGEYLYKIAKMYGCPEECIRLANSMPREGDEQLSIGQELVIPECTCTLDGKILKAPSEVPEQPAAPTVKKQLATPEKKTAETPKKPRVSILDDTDMPAQYSNEDPSPAPERIKKNNLADDTLEENVAGNRDDKKAEPNKKPKADSAKVPLFKEHHVKQGENLKSIAAKYRVDVSELSQVNGLDPKEALIPGKLILIPIEEE